MSATHTPGPWRLDDAKNAPVISDIYHTVDAGCGFLCPGEQPERGFGLAGYMTLADARLIAAAPELLDAAEAARNVLFLLQDEVSRLGLRANKVDAKLAAAIAKATGGAS